MGITPDRSEKENSNKKREVGEKNRDRLDLEIVDEREGRERGRMVKEGERRRRRRRGGGGGGREGKGGGRE